MERTNINIFLKTIKEKGIIIDPHYPESASLCFENVPAICRFWEIPDEARRIPYFVATILDSLKPNDSIYVWKHLGSWISIVAGDRINDDVQAVIYRAIGILEDSSDVFTFNHSEQTELVVLIFNQLLFGWHVGDDLYIVPSHGKYIVQTDHHDVVHVSFRDKSAMDEFVRNMAEQGFELPTKLPDETFKKPDWIA